MSHFTENIESKLQEIYNESDEENDEHQELPQEMKPRIDYRRDSLITPIKIEKVPDIDLETPKMTNGPDDVILDYFIPLILLIGGISCSPSRNSYQSWRISLD